MPSKWAPLQGSPARTDLYLSEWLLSQGYEVHGIVRQVALEVQPMTAISLRLKSLRAIPRVAAPGLEFVARKITARILSGKST